MNHPYWISHFERNRQNRPEPAWDAPFHLAEPQRRALAWSLAEYQLGDGGGPCKLIARDAERYRETSPEVKQVIDLWFSEEREHSRLLLGAVKRLRGTVVHETFAFRAFCAVRRLLGVQFEMLVLLLVEIVSTAYYRLIRRHCGDGPIDDMCRLIIRDEVGHIAFHRARLGARHPAGPSSAWRLSFHALGHACAAFLWLGHGKTFRTIGATRSELFRQVASGLRLFLRQLDADRRRQPQRAREVTPVVSLGSGVAAGVR